MPFISHMRKQTERLVVVAMVVMLVMVIVVVAANMSLVVCT